jgi:hypothetical protein
MPIIATMPPTASLLCVMMAVSRSRLSLVSERVGLRLAHRATMMSGSTPTNMRCRIVSAVMHEGHPQRKALHSVGDRTNLLSGVSVMQCAFCKRIRNCWNEAPSVPGVRMSYGGVGAATAYFPFSSPKKEKRQAVGRSH